MTFSNHNWTVTLHYGAKPATIATNTVNTVTVQKVPEQPKKPTDITGAVQIILASIFILIIGGVWIKKIADGKFQMWWK